MDWRNYSWNYSWSNVWMGVLMNANELAQYIQEAMPEAATMLRQQQAEIEALKKEAALQSLSDFTQEADNEPVAWMSPDGRFSTTEGKLFYIPLYTHLANKKVKENTDLYEKVCNCTKKLDLTDEEIRNIANEIDLESGVAQWKYDFARAILRKA